MTYKLSKLGQTILVIGLCMTHYECPHVVVMTWATTIYTQTNRQNR